MSDYLRLPPDLPAPEDDGGADHLAGMPWPDLDLTSTSSAPTDLAASPRPRTVAYLYPRTGAPGRALPHGWDDIPGARGCTPQSCAYRDSLAEFARLDAQVIGISAQSSAEQREFAEREHIPFPLLSDPELRLATALRLPTFEVDGKRLYRRLTLIVEDEVIVKAFYPVFPPDRDAATVLEWLRRGAGS